jgi:trehalose 6-phosphate synthase/phosphatase
MEQQPAESGPTPTPPTTASQDQIRSEIQSPEGPRPSIGERGDSSSPLPPQLRESITRVPVTPGIGLGAYSSGSSYDNEGGSSPSYFKAKPGGDVVASPDLIDTGARPGSASSPSQAAAGAKTGHEILRRMGLAMGARRDSLSEIRASHPDLALSGNIISATFNIPHSLKYRKGSDWVRLELGLGLPWRLWSLELTLLCLVRR